MKKRKFYPLQVIRALQGDHTQLDVGQQAAWEFVVRRGRKHGLAVVSGPVPAHQDSSSRIRVRIFGDGQRADGFPKMSVDDMGVAYIASNYPLHG